ncbi:conserved hypothetical protein, secreted [Candidatus Magnetomorum sp. HK-1]|nr:conserved hypothetical protein, secreted [Candidatus Magnetomorum sp. HK-1]
MRIRPKKYKTEKGFTIVELLVYIGMSSIAMAAIMKIYVTNTYISSSQKGVTEMFQDVRAAMHIMTREIRMAGCDPLGTNKGRTVRSNDYLGFHDDDSDILDTDDNSIHFTHDSSGTSDGWAYSQNENIAYYTKGSGNDKILYRWCGITNTEYLLARNIKDFKINYYDDEGNEITISDDSDRAKIRVIKISITGQTEKPDVLTKRRKEAELTAFVRVRNLDL